MAFKSKVTFKDVICTRCDQPMSEHTNCGYTCPNEAPPHITKDWDKDMNPICVPDCPKCNYDKAEAKSIITSFIDIWHRSGTTGVPTEEANALIERAEQWEKQIDGQQE